MTQLDIAEDLYDLKIPPDNRLAKEIGVPAQRIGEIVAGRRVIKAGTDIGLCKYFGLSTGYWLRVQNKYDTEIVRRKIAGQLYSSITPLNRAV